MSWLEQATNDLNLTPEEQALYRRHLQYLNDENLGMNNPDGSRSSLLAATVEGPDGRTYLVPTLWNGLRAEHPSDLRSHVEESGGLSQFPAYSSHEAANARYSRIHEYMDRDTGDYLHGPNRQAARLTEEMPNILAGRPPAEREVATAYVNQFGGQEERHPSLTGGNIPEPVRRGVSGERITGKTGTEDEGLKWYSKVPGTLMSTPNGLVLRDPDGIEPDKPFTYNHGYNFSTGQAYEMRPPTVDRLLAIPLGRSETTGEVNLAWPEMIAGPAATIARATERAQHGISVPDSVLSREATEVAGAVMSGSAFGRGAGRGTALGMGASGTPPRVAAPPRQLDPAGYYSPLREAVQSLPESGPPREMFQRIVNQGGVSEGEIRHTSLDNLLLSPRVATARRGLMQLENDITSLRNELVTLQTPKGMNDFVIKATERYGVTEEQAAANGQRRIEQIRGILPNEERRLQSFRDNYHGVTAIPSRPSVPGRPGSGSPGRAAAAGIIDTVPDQSVTRQDVLAALNPRISRVRETIYTPREGVSEGTPALTPILDRAIQQATVDPHNPSLRWHTLRLDNPQSPRLQQLWSAIPERYRAALQAFRASGYDYTALHNLSPELEADLRQVVKNHQAVVNAIDKLETQSGHLDPHFHQFNIFGHYASSMQSVEGRPTLTVSQLQSSWAPKQQSGLLSHLPEHPIAANVQRWLDPTLRRIIKDAVDQGVDNITLPSADTVFAYNTPGADTQGLKELYNKIAPRRLQAMLRELDRNSPAPEHVSSLDPSTAHYPALSGGGQYTPTYNIPEGHVIRGVHPTTSELQYQDMRSPLQGSWLRFPLTDKVRQYHQGNGGMRLLSGDEKAGLAATSIANITDSQRRAARATDPQSLTSRIRNVQPGETEMRNYPKAERIEVLGPDDPHPGPVIGYHGTRGDFTVLDLSRSRDIGHHFGTRQQANSFAHTGQNGPSPPANVKPAYLNVHNPLTLPDLGTWDPTDVVNYIKKAVPKAKAVDAMHLADLVHSGSLSRAESYTAIRSALSDMGYDSIRYRNMMHETEGPGWSYIVWTPGRVRSVTDPTHQLYSNAWTPLPPPDRREKK